MSEVDARKLPFKRMLNQHIAIEIDGFKYSGLIAIPETAKRKPTKGTVVAVGDGITDILIGDKVLYSQFAGYLLIFDGMPQYRILSYSEILAILAEDSPELSQEGV